MKHLHIDMPSGVSGDVMLGALLDLGAPVEAVREMLRSLRLGDSLLEVRRVQRGGLAATQLLIREDTGEGEPLPERPARHEHPHDKGPQHHGAEREAKGAHPHAAGPARTLSDILALLEKGALSPAVRERSEAVFRRLARAEGAIHGRDPEAVHFHELSGADTIVDVVGTFAAVESLGVESVSASAVTVGTGFVDSAHGRLPLPAPATLALLVGAPVRQEDTGAELCTPTGAALVTSLAQSYGPMPPLRLERVGYGAGRRELPGRSNTLRLLLGTRAESGAERDMVLELAAHVDDMTGESAAHALESLLSAGALDASAAPLIMKKGRPGLALTVLCRPEFREAVLGALFRETSTFGVRVREVEREILAREIVIVRVENRPVRVKIGCRKGAVVAVHAEYEDCKAVAWSENRPFPEVRALAEALARKLLEGRKEGSDA
ncbi:MAG: nickel pincer cofactor biosynthesis protein LarC [Planctomycetota bacterium]